MFSKKMVVVIGVIALITVNFIILSVTSRNDHNSYGAERFAIPFVAAFQKAVTHTVVFFRNVWRHYFYLVATSHENVSLKQKLRLAEEKNMQLNEIVISNVRLRKLLNFQKKTKHSYLSAEVVGKDPSPWFKTIMIDKGRAEGIAKGFPVIIPEGIVGQVMAATKHYAKVLFLIDPNSAVDAMIQRTRARGIIKGGTADAYQFKYVMRQHDVRVGDTVVSSGLDGVYPKGIGIGRVLTVSKKNTGIFQEITVAPSVNFEKLEEVFVLLNHRKYEIVKKE